MNLIEQFLNIDYTNPRIDKDAIKNSLYQHLRFLNISLRPIVFVDSLLNLTIADVLDGAYLAYEYDISVFGVVANDVLRTQLIDKLFSYFFEHGNPWTYQITKLADHFIRPLTNIMLFGQSYLIEAYINGLFRYKVYSKTVFCETISPLIVENGLLHSLDQSAITWFNNAYAFRGIPFLKKEMYINPNPDLFSVYRNDQKCLVVAFTGLKNLIQHSSFSRLLNKTVVKFIRKNYNELTCELNDSEKDFLENEIAAALLWI